MTITQLRVGQRVTKELVIAYVEDIADEKLVQEVRERIERITLMISKIPDTLNSLLRTISCLRFRKFRARNGLIASSAHLFPLSVRRCISFISFHQGLIPTKLALSIADTRVGVPFPSLIEVLIMEVALEILREAGLRLPKPIGQTIGIVGGLVIGEAAVQAGIVSPIMVIVVAVTAISSFTIPQYNAGIALRILRFIAMIFAAVFGLYGVVLFFLMLCSHLVKLKSFGVPYISLAAPYRPQDWKDYLVRAGRCQNIRLTDRKGDRIRNHVVKEQDSPPCKWKPRFLRCAD